jgi:hypothetical protein
MILSLANIEDLADTILKDYLGALPDDADHVRPIDIEAFASRFLGLNVAYTRLSDTGDVLGLTTYTDVDVELERYMCKQVIKVAKNTVLIDDSLIKPDQNQGRRRFTISHECSHQILYRQEPEEQRRFLLRQYKGRSYSLRELVSRDDWCEWQANALGAALIMPPRHIVLLMQKFSRNRCLVSHENQITVSDKMVLSQLCEALEVSKSALVIRMRQLGLIVDGSSAGVRT